jgi:hypothetical protein
MLVRMLRRRVKKLQHDFIYNDPNVKILDTFQDMVVLYEDNLKNGENPKVKYIETPGYIKMVNRMLKNLNPDEDEKEEINEEEFNENEINENEINEDEINENEEGSPGNDETAPGAEPEDEGSGGGIVNAPVSCEQVTENAGTEEKTYEPKFRRLYPAGSFD